MHFVPFKGNIKFQNNFIQEFMHGVVNFKTGTLNIADIVQLQNNTLLDVTRLVRVR